LENIELHKRIRLLKISFELTATNLFSPFVQPRLFIALLDLRPEKGTEIMDIKVFRSFPFSFLASAIHTVQVNPSKLLGAIQNECTIEVDNLVVEPMYCAVGI